MDEKGPYKFGNFALDAEERVLLRDGEMLSLTPRAFDTLLCLVERAGRIVTKEELMACVWPDMFVEENNLTQNISLLRRVFGDDRRNPLFIQTVPKRGYRFCQPVERPQPDVAENEPPAQLDDRDATLEETPRLRPRWRTWTVAGVALACVLVAVTLLDRSRGAPPSMLFAPSATLAVLPYRVPESIENDNFAGVALADDLIRALQNGVTPLKVRTVCAVWRYAKQPPSPVDAARELGVDYVLANALEQHGKKTELHAQLVRASDGAVVWHGDFSAVDVFSLQDRLAERLRGAAPPAASHITSSLKAYAQYQRGLSLLDLRTSEGIYKATDALEAAVAADPRFALAYAELANAEAFDLQHWHQAEATARKAVALNPALGAPHATLGFLQMMWMANMPKAEEELKLAVRLSPQDATAHQWYADNLAMQGRMPEAIEEMKTAFALDADSVPINRDLAHIYYLAHHFDLAQQQCEHTIAMAPDFLEAHVLLYDIFTQKREYDRAMAEFEKAEQLAPSSGLYPQRQDGALKQAYARQGIRGFWRTRRDYFEHDYPDHYLAAQYAALLGDYPQAMAHLQKTGEMSYSRPHLLYLSTDPDFDALHGYQEFRRLSGLD